MLELLQTDKITNNDNFELQTVHFYGDLVKKSSSVKLSIYEGRNVIKLRIGKCSSDCNAGEVGTYCSPNNFN